MNTRTFLRHALRNTLNHSLTRSTKLSRSIKNYFIKSKSSAIDSVNINQINLELDLSLWNQRKIFWDSAGYEPSLQKIILDRLPENGTMIDCGANAGLFGFVALTKPATKVIFVEPHPRLAQQLRENIRRNNLEDRAKVIEAAASNVDGTATLITASADHDGSHSLVENKYSDPKGVRYSVKSLLLSDVIDPIEKIDLLKVDCEFFDLQAISGLGDKIKNVETIYIEMSYGQFDACFTYLCNAGFHPYETAGAKRFHKEDYLRKYSPERSRERDLYWTRQEIICS